MSAKKMTISQALRRRRQLKGAISTYTERISSALVYDVKNPPTFNFEDSNKALTAARFELISLESAIARRNATTNIEFKKQSVPLTWVLRVLAELKSDIARYEHYEHRDLRAQKETTTEEEESTGEIITITQPDGTVQRSHAKKKVSKTVISNITELERATKVEQLQAEFETLNDLLETANHTATIEYQDQPEEDAGDGAALQKP